MSLDDDRADPSPEKDRLGFLPIARHLANAIRAQYAARGFVFGIAGAWGSGKSFLATLTKNELRSAGYPEFAIVDFSPWLVGSREAIIHQLLSQLQTSAEAGSSGKKALADISKSFRTFSDAVSSIAAGGAKIAGVAAGLGIAGAGSVGNVLRSTSHALGGTTASVDIEVAKDRLASNLRFISKPIVVFVDDLDRLTPNEMIEMLRVVKAVADLPNVIYVLSYDPKALAAVTSAQWEAGGKKSYLDKFVQAEVRVPRPEEMALRAWLEDELERDFPFPPNPVAGPADPAVQRRRWIVDYFGGKLLSTPRDVVRVLNAIRFYSQDVGESLDVGDLIGLNLLRAMWPSLFEWVERYVSEATDIAKGAGESDGAAELFAAELLALLPKNTSEARSCTYVLQELLPTLVLRHDVEANSKKPPSVSFRIATERQDELIRARRLLSPRHSRLYFAFEHAAVDIDDREFSAIIAQSEGGKLGIFDEIRRLSNRQNRYGRTALESFLDRAVAQIESVPDSAISAVILAMADTLDMFVRSDILSWEGGCWWRAERFLQVGLKRLSPEKRNEVIRRIFSDGRALFWLSRTLNGETWAHGRFGAQPQPERDWILGSGDYEVARTEFLARMKKLQPSELLRTPRALGVLYAWSQAGEQEQCRAWVGQATAGDNDLLALLEKIGGAVSSSVQTGLRLTERDLSEFFDLAVLKGRLMALAETPSSELAVRAKSLFRAIVNQ